MERRSRFGVLLTGHFPAAGPPSERWFSDQGHDDGHFAAVGELDEEETGSDVFLQLLDVFYLDAAYRIGGEGALFVLFSVFLEKLLRDGRGLGLTRDQTAAGHEAERENEEEGEQLFHARRN